MAVLKSAAVSASLVPFLIHSTSVWPGGMTTSRGAEGHRAWLVTTALASM